LGLKEYLPDELALLFSEIEAPAGAFLGDVGGRFVSEVADGAVSQAASPFFESMGYAAYNRSPTKKMTPQTTAVLYSRNKISEDFFLERFRMGGFEPFEAKFQYKALFAYPSIPDIMLWARYHGDPVNTKEQVWKKFDVPVDDYDLWEWQTLQRLTTADCHTLFRRGIIDETEFRYRLSEIGWRESSLDQTMQVGWSIPNAMLLTQGNLLRDADNEAMLRDITRADIHPDYAQKYLDAVLTKPATTDLI
ncbi:unnamed protein product, partial [marine sediment metagenome]